MTSSVFSRGKAAMTEEEEPTDVSATTPLPQRSSNRLYSWDSAPKDRESHPAHQGRGDIITINVDDTDEGELCIEEEWPWPEEEAELPTGGVANGGSHRNTRERRPRHFSLREEHRIPQKENVRDFPAGAFKREVKSAQKAAAVERERNPPGIRKDAHTVRKTLQRPLISAPNCGRQNNNLTPDALNFLYTPSNLNLGLYMSDISPDSVKIKPVCKGDRIYSCTECDKSFFQNTALIRHVRTHTGEKPFSCHECGKSFTRKSILVEHQRIHTGEKPYPCPQCGKRFTQRSGVHIHQKTHERLEKGYCIGCRKPFNPTTNTDTGVMETSCGKCSKPNPLPATPSPKCLYEDGETVFLCPDCGKCFSQKVFLDAHQRVHGKEKQHQCSDCQKTFKRKSVLVEHQRIHTGERPFSCSICCKSFTQRSGLLMHQKIHTREKI